MATRTSEPDEDPPRSSRFPSAPPSLLPAEPVPPSTRGPSFALVESETSHAPAPERKSLAVEASRETFESQLARDILGAEQFRASLLAAIPTLALFALVVVRTIYPEALLSLLHGNVDVAPAGIFLIAVATFELAILAFTRRLLRRGERPSARWRYGQAFVETSLPTAVIVYYAAMDGPTLALTMPAVFLYFLFILLSTLRLDFFLSAFTGLVAAAEYLAVASSWTTRDPMAVSVATHHGSKAAILFVSGVAAGFVAQRLRRSFTRAIESVGERQRILNVFGEHVSPEVVDQLVARKAEAASERREVCVLFLDIRSFTAFTEKKSPEEVVDYLNTIFDSTVDAVVSRHGIVNKFLGDGFMAVFGAPVADENASAAGVAAALDIVERVKTLVREGKIPDTKIGIGLHAGGAVVGNIGSAHRKEYTVVGDVVNVASRLEALNKELGSVVLASDDVFAKAKVPGTAHPPVSIRGRKEPMRIWQLA